MIDSKYLQLVLAIEKCGSLNKASKELNLTQSALSHQLKNLEDYLGLDIFHRVDNRLYFTAAGKELRDKAEKILVDLTSLESRMIALKEEDEQRYIHGYNQKEAQRLNDQATSVAEFLHHDSRWEEGSTILEVGCGVGAQTGIIAYQNEHSRIVSIDISKESLEIAKSKIESLNLTNVEFRLQDVREVRVVDSESYDHIFVCFILEHLSNPLDILLSLRKVLKPNGTITVIEGDHGSTFFYPENDYSKRAIRSQVELQKRRGGNANIGRELYPLLNESGYKNIKVSPRQIYVDNSKPELVEGFIKNTFTAMIQGVSEDVISEKILSRSDFDRGIEGLLRTATKDGVFSYTFFKATAENPPI